MVDLRILGPVEVWRAGEIGALPGAKPRQLLTLLATRPNQVVASEVLIDELWDQQPPSTAASALRVHLARVRRLLEWCDEGTRRRLDLDAGGYVLRIEPDELDVLRFEHLVERGRDALAHGDVQGADRHLESALSLWRGPALADARDLAATKAAVTRLEQLRLGAVENLAEVRMTLGDAADAVDWLVNVVEEFPLHEGLAGHLMRALDRSGRSAEALRAYSRIQRDLDEQLGVAPSIELRRLEEDVLLQRRDGTGTRSPAVARLLPHSSERGSRFVGRRDEMERLLSVDATNRLVIVEGEAGAGKTTLVEEYCRRVRARHVVTLVGHCPEGVGDEYHAIKTMFGAAFPLAADARHAIADYEAAHVRLLDGIAATLVAMRPQSVVLVVEDLHWVDRASLQVLRHVLRHPELGHVRVVATMRSEDVRGPLAERIAALCSRTRTERIALPGLDEFEVRALIRSVSAPDSARTLADLAPIIYEATSGNPFHVRTLLQELDDRGTEIANAAKLRAEITDLAPAGVRALLERRLERLSPAAVQVVRMAAVVGAQVAPAVLGRLCDLEPAAVLDAIDEGIDACILVEDTARVDVITFPHALSRNSAYQSIPERDRAALHLRTASVFQQADGGSTPHRAADIAHHLLRARPLSESEPISEYARRAGDEAFEQLAFGEAAGWYECAVEHCDPAAVRREPGAALLMALGRALEADHAYQDARAAYLRGAELPDLDDVALRADLAIAAFGPWTSVTDDHGDVRPLLRACLDAIGTGDPVRRLRLTTALATHLYSSDTPAQGELVAEALALARDIGDDEAFARAHMARHLWLTHDPPACAERLRTAKVAMRHAHDAGSQPMEVRVSRELLADLLECGRRNEFDATLDSYEALATETSSPYDMYWAMVLRATQAMLDGDLATGEQLARGAGMRGRALGQYAAGAEFLQQFVLRYQQGRLAELVSALGTVGTPTAGNRAGGALAAVAYAETGQLDEARRVVRWLLAGDTLPLDSFWLGAHALVAAAVVKIGDADLATELSTALEPCADHVVLFGVGGAVLGSGHFWLGQLAGLHGDVDAAVAHLESADEVAGELRAPYWIAAARRELGSVLARRSRPADRRRADALRADAVRIASEQGFYGF